MTDYVKFSKPRSATDQTFWAKFAELKIDKYKLDEKAKIHLWASYSLQSINEGNNNPLVLDCTSFNEDILTSSHHSGIACHGYMVNTNTFESFRETEPEKFIDSMGRSFIEGIKDGSAIKESWKLSTFLMLSYSDLKRYRFHYWTAHPTPFALPEAYNSKPPKLLKEEFPASQLDRLYNSFIELDCKSRNFFSVISSNTELTINSLESGLELVKSNENSEGKNIYFAFYDPCASPEPGWPLRNLLCLLYWHCPEYSFKGTMNIICIRGSKAQNSMIFTLRTKEYLDYKSVRENIFNSRLVGWETNSNGRMGPNIADLSSSMDPAKLSDRAINLNLKLMKWRLVPELELEKVSSMKCLLLGAGTLGCSVARVLLGWGVNNITFVDGSNVSHSNTVRQSLYSHQDAVEHKLKAHAARDSLLNIRPSLNAQGVVLHIPMPGHVVGQSMVKSTEESVKQLEELIRQSDVVFLLLDSREARWLPTLLCAAMNKIAINAALGFDSYTVQRHGTRNSSSPPSPDLSTQNPCGSELGCYFCNDVTQPGNSQADRTLDQQCTVSRPGLSQIAAGLAVELLVALMQHPRGIEATALMGNNRDSSQRNSELFGLLGGVPHTIRGYLWNYETQLTVTHRFPSCSACSVPLIKEYRTRGFNFILDACNSPSYLEKLSGLEELFKRPDLDELCYAMDSSSEDDDQANFKT